MFVCKSCQERISVEDFTDSCESFPVFSVVGSVLGLVGASLTGQFWLIPVATFGGALYDSRPRHCEICHNIINPDDEYFQFAEKTTDDQTNQTYFRAILRDYPENIPFEPFSTEFTAMPSDTSTAGTDSHASLMEDFSGLDSGFDNFAGETGFNGSDAGFGDDGGSGGSSSGDI